MSASTLFIGKVMHQRMRGPAYRFEYRVFSLLVDLDDYEQNFPALRWLSANRFNLFSVHARDLGPRKKNASLREWINQACADQGFDISQGRVLINTYPRVLGYQFNPLNVWYCFDQAQQLVAIDCEVSNTFGEFHHYLLHDHGNPLELPFQASADKVFHVSPFLDMAMRYHFKFNQPAERLSVSIRENALTETGEELTLVATHQAHRQPLSDRRLWLEALRIPLLTFKVIGLIHWHALKIWLKGGVFHKSPPKPSSEISSCPKSK
ncbi:DUF1365 domain-containing protein [Halothiobacillus neapolitanus]|uniref:DUF1365 domain-containing protein n=1 Tax=Halothiobacillus neapolitanus (strain ATCC 23641 / DSM 15147 / CIP 104769 / NCIMB 8539 / c2) TaxID=555778 RepID=D0L1Z0_HALNC|nr:DUF1365 domain-containing protein [Halothiobacillus neapolitanus]ACX96713.1 protein of unknown function DUF1365 [Halothiobacillus neapolitanus c2]TDN65177.1 hypothetical protein C8D83_102249 [Halothiobacillus neapolitanus]